MEKTKKDQKSATQSIAERLVNLLNEFYSPAEIPEDVDDSKSTQDIIREMGDVEEVSPQEVNAFLDAKGFKLSYTGEGYVWLLKLR